MIQKTKAIVLSNIKFQENSIIAYCYSHEFGRLSLLVNGAFSKGKKQGKAIYFQPFSVLNLVFYQNTKSNLNKLKEVEFRMHQQSIPFDPVKRSIALFLSEFIYRTVREEETNNTLYNFIENYIQQLDSSTEGTANSHLVFLAHLTQYIGFMPINRWSDELNIFDYKNGVFVSTIPRHIFYFEKNLSHWFGQILDTPLDCYNHLNLNRIQRAQIIDAFLDFYKYHLGESFEINSLPILSSVFQ